MKKFVFLLGLLFAMQTALMAQIPTQDVIFNANLHNTLNLQVTFGDVQTIDFVSAADYNTGVTELLPVGTPGIVQGYSDITVESTTNWNVSILCEDFTGTGGTIPINNLGVWCDMTPGGIHDFGIEVTSSALIPADALGLMTSDQLLIENLGGNMGAAADNMYRLHWEMGTMQSGNPSPMNSTSMFFQMAAAGGFTTGADYTATATLTLATE